MKITEELWTKYYKKACADLGEACKPSSGAPCALASIRIVRDGVLGDMSKDGKVIKECAPAEAHIRESIRELWEQLQEQGVQWGFASNASAAAKAAGFKAASEAVTKVAA